MILSNKALYATLTNPGCIELFRLHRREKFESWLLAKIRTLHTIWRPALLSRSLANSLHANSPIPLESSSKSTAPIYTTPRQVTVICIRGQNKVCFSGTLYRVVNQVALYLTTGTNGSTLHARSSTDLMNEVASSSYALALWRRRLQLTSTKPETESSGPAIQVHEELEPAKPRSLEVGCSLPPMRSLWNFDKPR